VTTTSVEIQPFRLSVSPSAQAIKLFPSRDWPTEPNRRYKIPTV